VIRRSLLVAAALSVAFAAACSPKGATAPAGTSTTQSEASSSAAASGTAAATSSAGSSTGSGPTSPAESGPATTKPAVKPAPGQPAVPPLSEDRGKKFAYVKRVWKSGGRVYVELDYAEMLTGKAAADAAKAAGKESPPPNDYFIRNQNTKVRTFRLGQGAAVRYLVGGESAPHVAAGANAFLLKWVQGAGDTIRDRPYWVWIDGDSVIRMEQVYLP
jgi:hypothetical protein